MTDRDLLAENGRLRFRIVELEEAIAEARKVIEPLAKLADGDVIIMDADLAVAASRWLQANK
jgi:hypothetical protein